MKKSKKEKMSAAEFYGELEKLIEKKWLVKIIGSFRTIRLYHTKHGLDDFCPITAVCTNLTSQRFLMNDYDEAAKMIGLNPKTAKRIADSADNNREMSLAVRAKLESILQPPA